jgi:hypothetical protein
MKTVGVLLELGRRFERLAALAALQIQHALRWLQKGCRADHFPRKAATTGPNARIALPGSAM